MLHRYFLIIYYMEKKAKVLMFKSLQREVMSKMKMRISLCKYDVDSTENGCH